MDLLGDIKIIREQGMPSQRHHEPGDLFVKLNVIFPESIDPVVIPLLEKALPARKPLDKFEKHTLMEEVELEDHTDTSSGQGARFRDEPMDEDGDEPRVQCANQ